MGTERELVRGSHLKADYPVGKHLHHLGSSLVRPGQIQLAKGLHKDSGGVRPVLHEPSRKLHSVKGLVLPVLRKLVGSEKLPYRLQGRLDELLEAGGVFSINLVEYPDSAGQSPHAPRRPPVDALFARCTLEVPGA